MCMWKAAAACACTCAWFLVRWVQTRCGTCDSLRVHGLDSRVWMEGKIFAWFGGICECISFEWTVLNRRGLLAYCSGVSYGGGFTVSGARKIRNGKLQCAHWPHCSSFRYVLIIFNALKPSGHYMYRQFNIQQFYVLSTQCIYVFCVDLRTNSDYFPIQH